jgi:hypothetical protein
MVLFGTVVAAKSQIDLRLMETSIDTLREAAIHSAGIAKLCTACETFFNLAKTYMAQQMQVDESQAASVLQAPSFMDDATTFYQQDWNAMLLVGSWDWEERMPERCRRS